MKSFGVWRGELTAERLRELPVGLRTLTFFIRDPHPGAPFPVEISKDRAEGLDRYPNLKELNIDEAKLEDLQPIKAIKPLQKLRITQMHPSDLEIFRRELPNVDVYCPHVFAVNPGTDSAVDKPVVQPP